MAVGVLYAEEIHGFPLVDFNEFGFVEDWE